MATFVSWHVALGGVCDHSVCHDSVLAASGVAEAKSYAFGVSANVFLL